MKLNSYLTFNGNCRDAMMFYKECLGGQLTLQTIGDSPLSEKMPAKMKKNILHSTLQSENIVMMASDMVGDDGLQKGNSVSLMLDCNDSEEAIEKYNRLSDGGKQDHALEITFWGALFGDLTDKFGNRWMIHCDK